MAKSGKQNLLFIEFDRILVVYHDIYMYISSPDRTSFWIHEKVEMFAASDL